MKWGLVGVGLLVSATFAQAAPNCSVPYIRTLNNQTVTGYMTVKKGRTCSIVLSRSAGPTYSAQIVARAAHGDVRIDGTNRVVYRPNAAYIGKDSFTYARRGLDERNNPFVRTVQVQVDVEP